MTDTRFQVGDEIEWQPEGAARIRGRVVKAEDGRFGVRKYDDLNRLEDAVLVIPSRCSLAPVVDQLAKTVPERYHLLPDEADICRCGKIDSDGKQLQTLDDDVMHRVEGQHVRDVWHKLIRSTAACLDIEDRSRPLEDRALPEPTLAEARTLLLCTDCFRLAVLASCYPEEPGRRTEEELREFLMAWMDRRVYSHLHIRQQDLTPSVFMCLAIMPPMPKDYIEKVGLIYEMMDEAGPRSINGQPMFMSHRILHVDDWKRVQPVIDTEEEHRKNLKI